MPPAASPATRLPRRWKGGPSAITTDWPYRLRPAYSPDPIISSSESIVRLLFGTLFALAVAAVVGLGADLLRADARRRLRRPDRSAPGPPGRKPARRTSIPMRAHRSRAAASCRSARATASRSPLACRRRRQSPRRALRRRRISGITPPARFWTLTLYDPRRTAGRQLDQPLRLHQPGDRAPRRRQLRDRRGAARQAGQLAADRRRRPLRAGAAPLRYAGRRCDQGRPRGRRCRDRHDAGAAHDPLAASDCSAACCSAASCIL